VPWSGPLFEGHVCSIGYELLDWIHEYECHGPGDVQGEPIDSTTRCATSLSRCTALTLRLVAGSMTRRVVSAEGSRQV
jgi:hypothetical protein